MPLVKRLTIRRISETPCSDSLASLPPMKLNRRKMLTAMGVAATSATLGKLEATDKRQPNVTRPASVKGTVVTSAPVCLADFEPLAKARRSHFAYEHICTVT